MAMSTLDRVVEEYHHANAEFVRGDVESLQRLFSHRDDVTLLNPRGTISRGWDAVSRTQEEASAIYTSGKYTEGETTGFDRVATNITQELACIAEVERYRARERTSGEIVTFGLRVTTVFRPEDGTWKIVHRHADVMTDVLS